jgi:flagellar hook capping protein FlgD
LHEGIFKTNIQTGISENYNPIDIYHRTVPLFKKGSENFYQNSGYLNISYNNGYSWSRIDSAYYFLDIDHFENNPQNMILARAQHGIMLSYDYGESWTTSNNGIDDQDRTFIYTTDYITEDIILISGFVPEPDQYTCTFQYRSVDGGLTWTKTLEANTTLGEGWVIIESVYNVDGILYAAFNGQGIMKSEDFGLTWIPVFHLDDTTFFELEYDQISSVFYTKTAYAFEIPGRTVLYKSHNGIDWVNCSQSFDNQYWIVNSTLNPNIPNQIFCSVWNRSNASLSAPHYIYSLDSGETWDSVYLPDLAPEEYILQSLIQPNSDEIIFSINERSIMSESLNFTSVEQSEICKIKTKLTNYPNPFNPSTTIRYGLPEDSKVNLQVYNVKGQVVKIIDSGMKEAGYHEVIWNGDDSNGKSVSSGIYFYKLQTQDFTTMDRMILLK